MTGLIVALTFVIALACFIGGCGWHGGLPDTSTGKQSRPADPGDCRCEMPLAVLSFLLVLVAMKIAIMFVLASGLWLVSLSQGSPS